MFNRKIAIASFALWAACLGGGGCHDAKMTSDAPMSATSDSDTAGLSKEELMARGDAMIRRGNQMKGDGAKLAPDEKQDNMSPDDLMMRGDEMIKGGMDLKDRATQM